MLICGSIRKLKPFKISKNTDKSITVQIVIAAPVFKIIITAMERYKTLKRKKLHFNRKSEASNYRAMRIRPIQAVIEADHHPAD